MNPRGSSSELVIAVLCLVGIVLLLCGVRFG